MQRKTIQAGRTEIDVFRQTDGSYRIDLERIARAIGIETADLPQSLPPFLPHGNAIETAEKISIELDSDRQRWVVTPEAAIAILQWQSMQGNEKALSFLNDLFSVAIEQYLDRSFEPPLSEKDAMWQAYLASERDRAEVYRRLASS